MEETHSQRPPQGGPLHSKNGRTGAGGADRSMGEVSIRSPQDDPLQGFLDACCELHPLASCRISNLWRAYEQWTATYQGRVPLSRRAFAEQLKARGCRTDRTSTARIWRGIALKDKNL